MSTGYTIEVGYLSGATYDGDWDSAWETLKELALAICDTPKRISDEARDYGAPELLDGEPLANYAYAFKVRRDLTITFEEKADADGNPERYIHMFASGGNPARALKEHTRRAFLRLLMQEAHRENIDISITVS